RYRQAAYQPCGETMIVLRRAT
ncbi:AMP-binding enzyme family protein, partial [Vibrio parahaemolyticus V-223/04]